MAFQGTSASHRPVLGLQGAPSTRVHVGKAPKHVSKRQPRLRRTEEPHNQRAAEESLKRRLDILLAEPTQHGTGKQRSKTAQAEIASLFCTRIKQARSGGEVWLLLRTAISEGVAGPDMVVSALDKLIDMHLRFARGGPREATIAVQAACELAMERGMVLMPRATTRMLMTMARARHHITYTVSSAEQQRRLARQAKITDEFIRLIVQSNPSKPATAWDLCQFIYSTFSSPSWHMAAGQRAALMTMVLHQEAASTQDYGLVLNALTTLKGFAGPKVVDPFLKDGTVAAIVDRTFAQMDAPAFQGNNIAVFEDKQSRRPAQGVRC